MKIRSYINNMGITKLSAFELLVINKFKEIHPDWTEKLSDREIYNSFGNTMSYNFLRLDIAHSRMGFSISNVVLQDIEKAKRWWEFWK